jgi:hypothetical protein
LVGVLFCFFFFFFSFAGCVSAGCLRVGFYPTAALREILSDRVRGRDEDEMRLVGDLQADSLPTHSPATLFSLPPPLIFPPVALRRENRRKKKWDFIF